MLRWVRANKSRCGLLALFALAMQLYLSFGHIHAEDLGLAPPAVAAAQAAADTQDGGPAPADHDEHDLCAICAALSLTASSVLPAVAPLPVPLASHWAWLNELELARAVFQVAANFHARAPPSV